MSPASPPPTTHITGLAMILISLAKIKYQNTVLFQTVLSVENPYPTAQKRPESVDSHYEKRESDNETNPSKNPLRMTSNRNPPVYREVPYPV
jgi:hypothetical protein